MKKSNGFKHILPDILVGLFTVILIAANICLSIYSQSGYMYEGEYVYSGSYSDGYKKIYKLNAEYDRKQNAMLMKLEEINNYPFEMENGTDVINNSYKFFNDAIVKLDEMDGMIASNFTEPDGNDNWIQSYLSGSLSIVSSAGNNISLYEKYVSFGEDGVILCSNDYTFLADTVINSYYLHKNGILTELSVQVVRIIITIITVVMLGLYLLIRVRKSKILISRIAVGVCLVMLVAVIAVTDYSMNGSYIGNVETSDGARDGYLTINPLDDGQYLVCSTTEDNTGARLIFEKKSGRLVNTEDEDVVITASVNGVKLVNGNTEIMYYGGDEDAINKWIPVLLFLPLVMSVIMLVYKIRNESMLEEMALIPFGQYVIQDIAYINEEMSDMESYYRDNMIGEEFIFHKSLCVTPSETIEEPLYKLEKNHRNLYPLQGKRKMNKIVIFREDIMYTNYYVAYSRKQCLLVQLLEDMVTVVYKLGDKQ